MKVGHTEFSKEVIADLKELTLEQAKEKYPHIREIYFNGLVKKSEKKAKK